MDWYQRHHRKLPWRKNRDPYSILVSEMMLQQTQVKTVIPYFERWMSVFPTVKSLAEAPESLVLKHWEGLGYYRRVRLLQAAARHIRDKHGGQFPSTAEEIAELPGVGPYTTGALGSIAFGLQLPVVDGNVIRVLTRWFGVRETTRSTATLKKIWSLAENLVPETQPGDFNQSLMELGALVCAPSRPYCLLCPIRKGCWAFQNEAQEELPNTPPRKDVVHQFEYAGLIRERGRVLLVQRPQGERMENLWQFPSITLPKKSNKWKETWKGQFGRFAGCEKLTDLRYTVTHHRIHLELHQIRGAARRYVAGSKWLSLAQARDLAFTAAHRKLANQFLVR